MNGIVEMAEHLLNRTQIWFMASIWQHISIYNSSFRESGVLVWPPWAPAMYMMHIYTHKQKHSHT